MAQKYIASRCAAPVVYARYGGADNMTIEQTVTVKGGHGLTTSNLTLVDGAVLTAVSDDDIALFMTNKAFLRHKARGYVDIIDHNDEHRAASELELDKGTQPLDINTAQAIVDKVAEQTGSDVELEEVLPHGKKIKPEAND
jgi:hypothetical protein